MKLVSAAKLRRATEKAHNSRPYEAELVSMVSAILRDTDWSSPLVEQRDVKRVAMVVISTDRGLAGSLNTNLFKLAAKRLGELAGVDVDGFALGKKSNDFFKKRGVTIVSTQTELARSGDYARVSEITSGLRKAFIEKKYDRVEVFYSGFQSALVQKPTRLDLLPFVPETSEEQKSFIYEPAAAELLSSLVPMLIDFRLFRVVLESVASEHGARMTAMESATKNAKEMIERLTLQRNRARQAAITKELMEIIGGAEALAG